MGSRLSAPGPQQNRFTAYIEGLAEAAGHADRDVPLKNYCTGLLLPGDRKNIEPMAARVAPSKVERAHQSMHHLVADALERRTDVGSGAETGSTGNVKARASGMDRRRYRIPKERDPFGGSGATIFWPDWQTGKLPGSGEPFGEYVEFEFAGCLEFIPARGLGQR